MSDNYNELFENNPNENVERDPEHVDSQNTYIDSEYHFKGDEIHSDSNFTRNNSYDAYARDMNDDSFNSAQWSSPYDSSQYTGAYEQNKSYGHSQYSQPNTQYVNYAVPKKEKKPEKGFSKGFVALMLVVCILLSSGLGFGGAILYTKIKASGIGISTNGAMVINKVDIDEETASKLADKPTSQITDEVADTVVEITTEVMSTNSFYGQYVSQGAGSGVIISSDGYIVTNNHVIEGASSITVTLRDKTTYEAQLVGTDSIVDVALLKVDAQNLHAATFGDSEKLKVGDKAVAIGNPLGQLGGTVTDGIISALDSDVVIDDEKMNLLQTDTAINPGNSGGGLFDGQGALVGVVVAKSSGEEIEGLGFAIPINDVVDIIDDLKEYGYVRGRVSVGMQLIDITNSMYSMYYYGNDESGCYVYSVDFDSAAYNAGIQQGDRIVSVDSKAINSTSDVEDALEGKNVGDTIQIELERGNRTATLELELGEYVPTSFKAQQNQDDMFNPFS